MSAATVPVTVVIPCYRCAGTIRRAIASVLRQTVRPTQVILVDDSSRDDTLETLHAVRAELGPDWVQVIALAENRGPSAARNAGWDAATTRYVAFLDADDAWHPEKLERQYRFMAAHPDIALSGHAARRLTAEEPHDGPVSDDGYSRIGRSALLLSNRFITPSVMVRRELPVRFNPDRRHMEDHLLWMQIACEGLGIARLNAELAYTFKAPFGDAGLSGETLAMELGELANYRQLYGERLISLPMVTGLMAFSGLKYARRLALLGLFPRGRLAQALFPVSFMTLTYSITGLYIGLGLLGRAALAAEIALVHGAILATFHALSANTRNIILGRHERISAADILLSRLVLVAPVALAAFALGVYGAGVATALALALVLRRAVEWINEVHLCEIEVAGRVQAAQLFLVLQGALLLAAVALCVLDPVRYLWVLYVWALAPMAFSMRYVLRAQYSTWRRLAAAVREFVPHLASTAIIGLAIFAYRLLVSVSTSAEVAGDVFTAIGIGSLVGTAFANVVGPSLLLHQPQSARVRLPPAIAAAVWATAALGVSMFVAALAIDTSVAGKSPFFWQATGLALAAGAVMVAAHKVRLRIVKTGHGSDVFGADLLSHVLLVAAVPVLVFLLGIRGFLLLYPINAVLSYIFYRSAEQAAGLDRRFGIPVNALRLAIGIGLLFPVFFLLTGEIYHVKEAIVDSGGELAKVPIPISVLACFGGIVLLGGYRKATPAMFTVLGMFGLMLLASLATTSGMLLDERRKLLLLIQTILPVFALVLGSVYHREGDGQHTFQRSALIVLAVLVPWQLIASWAQGGISLTHSLRVFSVYQSFQYVPVVIVCAYLIAFATFWPQRSARFLLIALAPLVAFYALGSFSFLSASLLVAAVVVFAWQRYRSSSRPWWLAFPFLAVAGGTMYLALAASTLEFQEKYGQFFPWISKSGFIYSDKSVHYESGVFNIAGKPRCPTCYLIALRDRVLRQPATFVAEGELRRGSLVVGVVKHERWDNSVVVRKPGRFRVEVPASAGINSPIIAADLNEGDEHDATLYSVGWADFLATARTPEEGMLGTGSEGFRRITPKNLVERFYDWQLFVSGIVETPVTVLFGHAKPMDRQVRTSAHNYYIDFVYNFGLIALLPLLALIGHTGRLILRNRHAVLSDPALGALAAITAFLVLVDSNFKVTLRQPYPGIFAFFLWGLLVAQLQRLGRR